MPELEVLLRVRRDARRQRETPGDQAAVKRSPTVRRRGFTHTRPHEIFQQGDQLVGDVVFVVRRPLVWRAEDDGRTKPQLGHESDEPTEQQVPRQPAAKTATAAARRRIFGRAGTQVRTAAGRCVRGESQLPTHARRRRTSHDGEIRAAGAAPYPRLVTRRCLRRTAKEVGRRATARLPRTCAHCSCSRRTLAGGSAGLSARIQPAVRPRASSARRARRRRPSPQTVLQIPPRPGATASSCACPSVRRQREYEG